MVEFKKRKLGSLKFCIQNKMDECKDLCRGLLQRGGYTRRLGYN